MDLITSLT